MKQIKSKEDAIKLIEIIENKVEQEKGYIIQPAYWDDCYTKIEVIPEEYKNASLPKELKEELVVALMIIQRELEEEIRQFKIPNHKVKLLIYPDDRFSRTHIVLYNELNKNRYTRAYETENSNMHNSLELGSILTPQILIDTPEFDHELYRYEVAEDVISIHPKRMKANIETGLFIETDTPDANGRKVYKQHNSENRIYFDNLNQSYQYSFGYITVAQEMNM